MADQSDYSTVSAALLIELQKDINDDIPAFERSMIPIDLAPKLAGALAKTAVDTLDAHRAKKT